MINSVLYEPLFHRLFPREVGLVGFPWVSFSVYSRREPMGSGGTGFLWVRSPFCDATGSVKTII